MTHPTDGELRAVLDGEAGDRAESRIRGHLRSCGSCRDRRDELRNAERATREALSRLESRPEIAAAREAVRRRLAGPDDAGEGGPDADDAGTALRTSRGGRRWRTLARAAAVVLFLGTAFSAALPGSPVREWVEGLFERSAVDRPGTTAPTGEQTLPGNPPASPAAGVRVEPADGAVRIRLREAEPGTRIRVALVGGSSAGVEAPEGVRFRSGPGFVEAEGIRGETRVEIPRDVPSAEVRVDGRVLFRKEGPDVRLPSADPDTVGAELLFRVPGPESGRSP